MEMSQDGGPRGPSRPSTPASPKGSTISVVHVSKRFKTKGENLAALEDVSLECRLGEMVVIIGASGCGKTTLLRIVAGFERPDAGRVMVDGVEVTGPMPGVGVIFQDLYLFPWLDVRHNVEFGLVGKGLPPGERQRISMELLRTIDLEKFHRHWITQLSGGMRQRVAIARSLATDPRYLLLDEPFGALDEQTRMDLQEFLDGLRALTGKSMVLITHSISEAVYLADRIVVMSPRPGRVVRCLDVPLRRPRDRFSREFAEVVAEVGAMIRRPSKLAPVPGGLS